ncbi:MAG: hypothetical protein LBF54_01865 [Holosporaceae bacterium]|nr:hypothetical protein [Holosporaceae bacterium]
MRTPRAAVGSPNSRKYAAEMARQRALVEWFGVEESEWANTALGKIPREELRIAIRKVNFESLGIIRRDAERRKTVLAIANMPCPL